MQSSFLALGDQSASWTQRLIRFTGAGWQSPPLGEEHRNRTADEPDPRFPDTAQRNAVVTIDRARRASGNVRYRVMAVVPIERVAEFIEKPVYALLEVEPL
jgi:hypothetical protein